MAPPYVEKASPALAGRGSLEKIGCGGAIDTSINPPPLARQGVITQAFLTPIWSGTRTGYVYDVRLAGGETILRRSRDPETDLARALKAQGVTGSVVVIGPTKKIRFPKTRAFSSLTSLNSKANSDTGRPRSIVNIDAAARVSTVERSGKGLRFEKRGETVRGAPYSPGRVTP